MTIIEFLNTRLNDDEAVAWTAIGKDPRYAVWAYTKEYDSYSNNEVYAPHCASGSEHYPVYVTMDSEGLSSSVEAEQGHHIARHDPARVLREVAAKRQILNIHRVDPEMVVTYNKVDAAGGWATIGHTYPCQGCGVDSIEYVVTDIEECPELRAIASVYADHEDYRKEWADDGTV